MKIEKITPRNITKIIKLFEKFNEEYFKTYNIKDNPPMKTLAKQKKKIFEEDTKNKKGIILAAKKDDNYIGYIFAIKGLPHDKSLKSKAYISDLFIKKNFRKEGIAEKLIRECDAWCKREKRNEIFIDVNLKNSKARKLYQKMKFKEQKIRLSKKL